MIYLGPIIFGFIIGLILGITMKNNPQSKIKFTKSSFVVIIIVAIIVSWQLGQYPFYDDSPIANGFFSAVIGILVGKLIFGRQLKI
jgi:energy-converting hydrogenase B subunit J